jgi:hypothetical protein
MPIKPLWVGKIITVWEAETAKSPEESDLPCLKRMTIFRAAEIGVYWKQ